MLKKLMLFSLAALLAVPVDAQARDSKTKEKIEIVTTLFATYDFAKQIGRDKVRVSLLLPPGIEPHSFEPRPADVVRTSKADIFIYTGKYMEPWVEDILGGVSNKNLTVVDASRNIALMGGDPHIWLDLGKAQVMVETIAGALAQKDASDAEFYLENAREYNARIADLDGRFRDTFSGCRRATIISGGHFTFGYFTRRYTLQYVSAYEGFSPNAEPGPRAIAELIDNLKKSGTRYVYYEELLDPKVARIIAQETGAKIELLHGAHNVSRDELRRGVGYLEIMEENLKKLKAGLECP